MLCPHFDFMNLSVLVSRHIEHSAVFSTNSMVPRFYSYI